MSKHRRILCNLSLYPNVRVVVREGTHGPKSFTVAAEKQSPKGGDWVLSGDVHMAIAGVKFDVAVLQALRFATLIVSKRERNV